MHTCTATSQMRKWRFRDVHSVNIPGLASLVGRSPLQSPPSKSSTPASMKAHPSTGSLKEKRGPEVTRKDGNKEGNKGREPHGPKGRMQKGRETRTSVHPDEICYPQQTPVKRNRISLPLREALGMQMTDWSTFHSWT